MNWYWEVFEYFEENQKAFDTFAWLPVRLVRYRAVFH